MNGNQCAQLPDEKLLALIGTQGGQNAFAELIRRYGDLVYSLALRSMGNPADADDAVQNIWLKIIRNAKQYSEKGTARAWIGQITVHETRDMIKQRTRERHRDQTAAKPEVLQPATELEDREMQSLMEMTVRKLPETDREVVLLHYYEGFTQNEVASALGLSEATTKWRIHQALESLRSHLAKTGVTLSAGAMISTIKATPAYALPATLETALTGLTAKMGGIAAGATLAHEGIRIGGTIVKTKTAMFAVTALATTCFISGIGWEKVIRSNEWTVLKNENDSLQEQLSVNRQEEPDSKERTAQDTREITDLRMDNARLRSELQTLQEEGRRLREDVLLVRTIDTTQEIDEAIRQLEEVQGKKDAEKLSKAINTLIEMGTPSIPAISRLLQEGRDVHILSAAQPEPLYGTYPSLRIGLFHALRRIGGTEAQQAALIGIRSAKNALELYETGQLLIRNEEKTKDFKGEFVKAIRSILKQEPQEGHIKKEKEALEHKMTEELKSHGINPQSITDPRELPPDMIEWYKQKSEEYQDKANQYRPIDSYGLEFAMIRFLDATQEMIPELEEYGKRRSNWTGEALRLLAVDLDPSEAFQVLQRAYMDVQKGEQIYRHQHLVEALATIHSQEANNFLLQIFNGLNESEQNFVIQGVMTGLNIGGRGPGYETPFPGYLKQTHSSRRQVTPEAANRALNFLSSLESTAVSTQARAKATQEIERLREWMKTGQLYNKR
jgi:RNA polymerase sigma-70 factor (ECF subfamily)